MWLTFFCVSTAATACASLAISVFAARRAARALASPPQRLRSVESRLQSVEQLAEEHTQAMTDLANRLKMIKVRSAASHGFKSDNELPDAYRDPEGWRRAMNSRLAQIKLNGA
jgi:DNA repair ATPase RecN